MFCPKCGSQNDDSARFCAACGAPLPSRDQQPVTQASSNINASVSAKNRKPIVIAACAVAVLALSVSIGFALFGGRGNDSADGTVAEQLTVEDVYRLVGGQWYIPNEMYGRLSFDDSGLPPYDVLTINEDQTYTMTVTMSDTQGAFNTTFDVSGTWDFRQRGSEVILIDSDCAEDAFQPYTESILNGVFILQVFDLENPADEVGFMDNTTGSGLDNSCRPHWGNNAYRTSSDALDSI